MLLQSLKRENNYPKLFLILQNKETKFHNIVNKYNVPDCPYENNTNTGQRNRGMHICAICIIILKEISRNIINFTSTYTK